MKRSCLTILLLMSVTVSYAAIYKWVDEKGTTHFSDKPHSRSAEKIVIQETGITVHNPAGTSDTGRNAGVEEKPQDEPLATSPSPTTKKPRGEEQAKIITEDDYRISANVGKLGADMLSISGRVSSGPACKDMVITATARNENGLSASITQHTSKATSYGSTIFEGTAKAAGSRDDLSFWKIDSVIIRCND